MEQIITHDKLKSLDACGEGLEWFDTNYPNGATIEELLGNKRIATHYLHWGFTHFITNAAQKAKYWERVEVDDSSRLSTHSSFKVSNSCFVSNSVRVRDSKYVFDSNDVRNCENVWNSKSIKTSSEIYRSNFVSNSLQIDRGLNITNCANIINGTMMVECDNCSNMTDAISSRFCNRCDKLRNCYFCESASNLKNCLFCYGISSGENLIYNKPADPAMIEIITNQIDDVLGDWSWNMVEQWPQGEIPLYAPAGRSRFQYYSVNPAPELFWDWAISLPNFDKEILINITGAYDKFQKGIITYVFVFLLRPGLLQ